MTGNERSSHWLSGKGKPSRSVRFGRHLSYWMNHSPRRMLHSMSYYKFASKMIGMGKSVLDIGCGEGLGTWLLAKECGRAAGLDMDAEAVRQARENWPTDDAISFCDDDILREECVAEGYDAIVSFDVIEHILPDNVARFHDAISSRLHADGIVVIGTPSEASDQFANEITRAGHVNLYSSERLEAELRGLYRHVFLFSANDEVVHTGFPKLAHYYIAVACQKK